jgi:hypothetical protein
MGGDAEARRRLGFWGRVKQEVVTSYKGLGPRLGVRAKSTWRRTQADAALGQMLHWAAGGGGQGQGVEGARVDFRQRARLG